MLRENNWKLRGIVNGMDYTEWSPSTDKFLSSDGYRHFNIDNFEEGKAACKAALQRVNVLSSTALLLEHSVCKNFSTAPITQA